MDKKEKIYTGRVISNFMEKTITVVIERKLRHPFYGKYVSKSFKLHVHDEENKCNVNDVVKVAQNRPLSKTKKWCLVEIIEKAN